MSKAILVPLDGSAGALRALDHAMKEARRGRATVHLLNVELPMDDYGLVPAYLSVRRHREITQRRAREILDAGAARLKRARVACSTHVAWDDPAAAIARSARRLRCGSIVMGTRGMGAAGNLLLGSTVNKVIQLAKVPVTVVK